MIGAGCTTTGIAFRSVAQSVQTRPRGGNGVSQDLDPQERHSLTARPPMAGERGMMRQGRAATSQIRPWAGIWGEGARVG